MDKVGRLLLFADVVQSGSFVAAARRRHVTRSVVSKQMARLEEELDARLLQRTTRSLSLTDVGRALFQQVLKLREQLEETENLAATFQNRVTGELRITCPFHLASDFIQPVVGRFLKTHPKVKVQLYLADRFVDLVAEGFDLGIRITQPQDSSLVARKLAENGVVLVASPHYLSVAGVPRKMTDLEGHRCIVYTSEEVVVDRWKYFEDGDIKSVKVNAGYQVNSGQLLVKAAQDGIGIALIPVFLANKALRSKNLVQVLPEVALQPYAALFAIYPARAYLPPKTKIFLEYLIEHIGEPPRWLREV